MRLCTLFSGGKDSMMAVHRAKKEGHEVSVLLSMISKSSESYMYHVPNIGLTKYSSIALGIPLETRKTSGKPPQENHDLRDALKEIKKGYGIEGIATGAVASNYQFNIISGICRELDLKIYAPYWKKDHGDLIQEAIDAGYEIIFVGVAAMGLDESWLGRRLDEKAFHELKELNKKYCLSVGGEGGEYETMVLDGPYFRKRIEIKRVKKVWEKTRGELVVEEVELRPKSQDP